MNEVVQVICSEDGGFDAVGQSLILKQDEDLWRTAKPLTHRCILGDQTLQSRGIKGNLDQQDMQHEGFSNQKSHKSPKEK